MLKFISLIPLDQQYLLERAEQIFDSLVADTSSRLANFAPDLEHEVAHFRAESNIPALYRPIWFLPSTDILAIPSTKENFLSIDYLVSLGRPLWKADCDRTKQNLAATFTMAQRKIVERLPMIHTPGSWQCYLFALL
jgi:hypothetical protein